VAFTEYFGDVLDTAFATLNPDMLRGLVLPECRSCSGAISSIEDYRERQERYDGKYAAFTSSVFASSDAGVTKVLAHSETAGAKVVDSRGSIVRTIPPQSGNLSVQLKFDQQWRVAEVQGVA
jgi:hypothetical protein